MRLFIFTAVSSRLHQRKIYYPQRRINPFAILKPMFTKEVVQYIKDSLAEKRSEDEIRTTLRGAGWQQADVDAAFSAARGEQAAPALSPAEPAPANAQPPNQPIRPNPYANCPGGRTLRQTTIVQKPNAQTTPIHVVAQSSGSPQRKNSNFI